MIKILYIIDSMLTGGKERRLIELLKGIKQHKDILCSIIIFNKEIHFTEINKLDVSIRIIEKRKGLDLSLFSKIYNVCKEIRPNIIHTWCSAASIYAIPPVILLGIKFVNGMISTAPNHIPIFSDNWLKSFLSFPISDIIVANSQAGLYSFKVPLNKSIIIHNGFDKKRLKMIDEESTILGKYRLKEFRIIGMVANFTVNKDYDTFINVAWEISKQRSDVLFVAVGDGPLLEECRRKADYLKLRNLLFLGRQSNIESIVNCLEIGVLTSGINGEGLSNSVIEYMAFGKPVIATRSGGTAEIVRDGETGFLITPFSKLELYQKITILLENTELGRKMGIAGQERIFNEFDIETSVIKYVNLYKSLVIA
jgi:glycosyltransferase involved in cell wall biosynthesis